MFNIKTAIAFGAASMLAVGVAQAATTNGFANGGFETAGVTTPAASWLAAAAGYSLSTDSHTGAFSAQLMSPALNAAVMLQNSIEQGGMAPLTAGDVPMFSFYAKGFAGTTGNVLFALRYLDGTGNILANSNNQFFQGLINPTTWTQINYTLPGGVPVGATAAFVEFSQAMGPIDIPGGLLPGAILVDDLYLGVAAPIPEPETYALMLAGLAGIGMMVRRRRA